MDSSLVAIDDPRSPDVRVLLEAHLNFARDHTHPEDVHALDVDALLEPSMTFFSLRERGVLLGVGALRQLDPRLGELKSIHTAEAGRGGGVGRAIVAHLVGVAAERGMSRVSLETGSGDGFAPARALFAAAGFVPCGPFGDYPESPERTFMTLVFNGAAPRDRSG